MLYILTLAEIKADLGLEDPKDDVEFQRWAEGLQGRFDDYLQRTLLRTADAVELHDGGGRSIWVRHYPVESVASVHVDADQDWDENSLLDPEDYRVDKARGRLVWDYGNEDAARDTWESGVQNIRVVLTGGYVAAGTVAAAGQTAMPDGLRRMFMLQLGYEWRNRLNLGRQGVSAQGVNVNLAPAELLPEVKAGLQPYRRW